jgi:hypothetical protein
MRGISVMRALEDGNDETDARALQISPPGIELAALTFARQAG